MRVVIEKVGRAILSRREWASERQRVEQQQASRPVVGGVHALRVVDGYAATHHNSQQQAPSQLLSLSMRLIAVHFMQAWDGTAKEKSRRAREMQMQVAVDVQMSECSA